MKSFPKINFQSVLMETGGQAIGVVGLDMLNKKVKFVGSAKPALKGIIYKGVAKVLLPMLAGKAKKGSDLINGVAQTFDVAGTTQLVNAAVPGKYPSIGGYEDNPISGPGYEFEEVDDEESVSGPFDEDEYDD